MAETNTVEAGQTWTSVDAFGDPATGIGVGVSVEIESVTEGPEPGVGGEEGTPSVVFTWVDAAFNDRRTAWTLPVFTEFFTR